jgi:hypothetical protein
MQHLSRITVTGLTEVEAGKLRDRLNYMKTAGLLSGKVKIDAGTDFEALADGVRRSSYGGL